MVQDNRAAPPNTSQVEAAGGDLEEATENQQGELDEDGVAELNEQIAKEQEEARDFWAEERAKRIEESEGLHVGDPLKPSEQDEKARKADAEDAKQKNEAAKKEREAESKKAGEDAKKASPQPVAAEHK
jgi:membrane protein involved in colicin uptake